MKHHRFFGLVTATMVAVSLAGLAHADRSTDLVFSEDVLTGLKTGASISYDHVRSGEEVRGIKALDDGRILLRIVPAEIGDREVLLEIREGDKLRSRVNFPSGGGNPMVMVFLESALRAVAGATGGSPFYLRNRMKDSLRRGGTIEPVKITVDGKEIDALKITFKPFVNDKNADRMGEFSKMELIFVTSEEVPGGFALMEARVPGGEGGGVYDEAMRFKASTDPQD